MHEIGMSKSELSNETLSLLEKPSLGIGDWREEAFMLEYNYGSEVYSKLLSTLTNLEFSAGTAKLHWKNVLKTGEELGRVVEGHVDIRVAALHYFLEVQRKLKNPTILELKLFKKVLDSVLLDELTDLYNYRYFKDRLTEEVKRGKRLNLGLSLLMLDADDFKAFNDRHGHQQGNEALRQLARIIKESVREVDVVARYGGEEFAIILPTTMREGSITTAEKIRANVETKLTAGGESWSNKGLTVSIGAATLPSDATGTLDLIQKADAALYTAKRLGKNKVRSFSDERRDYERFETSLTGRIQRIDCGMSPIVTSNISQGGLLVNSRQLIPVDSIIQIAIDLAPNQKIACTGRVVRVVTTGQMHQLGVMILHIERRQIYQLQTYLLTHRGNSKA